MNKVKFRKAGGRILSALTVGCILGQMVANVVAFADIPRVLVDETMYVNMSYYGAVDQVNVVKGLTFYDVYDYTDYGNYTRIQNMTDESEPTIEPGKVIWKAPEGRNKFFFEGTMKPEEVEIPWKFNVSYKWNGIVADAAQLAGASGLIEIDIDAIPNREVNEYLQNNMMLLAAVPVDMSRCYSVEAPGAQMQTLGEETVAIFAALPGEEGHFTVRMGTDCFETTGVIMMMMPGTFSALDHVKDLKETRDVFREDGDRVMQDMEQLLGEIAGMQTQLDDMNRILDSLDQANQKIQTAQDGIFKGTELSIEDLKLVSDKLTPIDTFFRTAQWLVYDLNGSLNQLNQDVLEVNQRSKSLRQSLRRISGTADGIDVSADEIQEQMQGLSTVLKQLLQHLQEAEERSEQFEQQIEELLQQLPDENESGLLHMVLEQLGETLCSLQERIRIMEDRLNAMAEHADKTAEQAAHLSVALEELLGDSSAVGFQLSGVLYEAGDLAADLDTMTVILDSYYPDIQAALEAAAGLTEALQRMGNNLSELMAELHRTVQAVAPDLNAASDQSLQTGRAAISSTKEILDTTAEMQKSLKGLHQTVDEELDRVEQDSNFLNMDPEAGKISLTSGKNQEPESVQIICRTDEIHTEKEKDKTPDAETVREANMGPIQRIGLVFRRILRAIVEIISEI